MIEQQRLCGDSAYATGAQQLRNRDQLMESEDDEFAHEANGNIITGTWKTARRRRIASHYEFVSHRPAHHRHQ